MNAAFLLGQFVRLGETGRLKLTVTFDGKRLEGMRGDSLLTLLLLNGRRLRDSEFGDGPRAGFCNMNACQDCWIVLEDGQHARACSTYAVDGMAVFSKDRRWVA